jgi:hypothetical protein
MALQTSNIADVLVAASTPFLRSPSPTPEPAKLSPSLKQPSQQQAPTVQAEAVRRQSPKKPGASSKQRLPPVIGSKRSFRNCLVVEDDSKPGFKDIGSAFGLQTVVLRPPFSLF